MTSSLAVADETGATKWARGDRALYPSSKLRREVASERTRYKS